MQCLNQKNRRERESERDREAQIVLYIQYGNNQQQATTLCTICRNSLNLDYPRDGVNTSIINVYSTLPRNGRIHTRLSNISVLFESTESENKGLNRPGSEVL